jgi:integrative and conjugative element protein (TIGR02256 family)
VKYLEGKITGSKTVSYQGDDQDALTQNLRLSKRYQTFSQSLKPTSLYNPQCRFCRGKPAITFTGCGLTVNIAQDVYEQFQTHRQLDDESVESAGFLVASQDILDDSIWIDGITLPKSTDENRRSYFKLDHRLHKEEVEDAFHQTNGRRAYMGTWHTHPQQQPKPSKLDKDDWLKHVKVNPGRQLVFIIVGNKRVKAYTHKAGHLSKLKAKKA